LPYPGLSNAAVIEQVQNGYRLPPPEDCPEDMYKIMGQCWASEPAARPTFEELAEKLEAMGTKYNQATIMAEYKIVQNETTPSEYNN
jgi:hypothetical protein